MNLFLIDANSIIHRCFHALPTLTTSDGRPAQAVYGLASILLKIWREEKPDYAAALFDRPEPTFRKEKYIEYKAQRPAAPEELITQIIEAHSLFNNFGIAVFEKPGFEADDLIATLAEKFRTEPDLKTVILTGDLDTLQLVDNEKIVVRTFKKGISETFLYNEKAVGERFGLKPDQLVDYKALVGDPSDNIKGVSGIGPKTAGGLLKKFGSLKNFYQNSNQEPRLAEKILPFREQIELNQSLVLLNRRTPLELNSLDELRLKFNQADLEAYFSKLGFESLIKRLNSSKSAENNFIEKKKLAARREEAESGEPKKISRPTGALF